MALEPFGFDWRREVPAAVFNAQQQPDDTRTSFIACTMAPAIAGEPHRHWKFTQSEVDGHANLAVGKPLVDAHDNNESIGEILAAGVDDQKRIWVRGVIDYTVTGNSVLRKMRSGHYWGVSWRKRGFSYVDPSDGQVHTEKSIENLAITSDPEYGEHSRIYFVADDPPAVKRINLLGKFDTAIQISMEKALKKQSGHSTIKVDDASVYEQTPATKVSAQMSAEASTTTASTATTTLVPQPDETSNAASATTAATPAAVTTPASVASTAMSVDPPVQKVAAVVAEPVAPPVVATPAQQQQAPATVINYNFGVPLGAQNQFVTPSSVQAPPSQPTQVQQPPMSVAKPETVDTAVAEATPVGAAAPVGAATLQVIPQAVLDEMRRSIVAEMKATMAEVQKAQQPPVPAVSAVPLRPQPDVAATESSATPSEKIDSNLLHDSIKKASQMRDEISEAEKNLSNIRDLLSNEKRLESEAQIAQMKEELCLFQGALVEGFEKSWRNYRDTFKVPAKPQVDGEVSRMKEKLSEQKFLGDADLKWLGITLELTSESSNNHKRLDEEREKQVLAQQKMANASLSARHANSYSAVTALRTVLSLDPKPQPLSKRPREEPSFGAAPEQKKQVLTRTQEFQRQTGIPWTVVEENDTIPHRPAPPRSFTMLRDPHSGARFQPPPKLPDSIFATGQAYDPSFSMHIKETHQQFASGVIHEPILSAAALAELSRL